MTPMEPLTMVATHSVFKQQSDITDPGYNTLPLKESNNTHAQDTFWLSLVSSAAAYQSPRRFLASANHKHTLPKSNNPIYNH